MDVKVHQGKCLGCQSELSLPFLDLGSMPLANAYVEAGEECEEKRYPLAVSYCRVCQLVQIREPVAPAQLFESYAYFSSYSETVVQHAREMADALAERCHLGCHSKVLEIASNDGYLLRHFQKRGVPVLGIEPALNVAAEATRGGVPTLARFFGREAVGEVVGRFGLADLIVGNNVLAHVPGINEFLQAVADCMKPDGVAVFEVPYVRDLLERTEFDTIYHEHVFYYSLSAIRALAERASLELHDVSWQSVHGGSLRVFLRHSGVSEATAAVREMLAAERESGLTEEAAYSEFGDAVKALRKELRELLWHLRAQGARVAAYGAPAKGNTLLNYCNVDRRLIEFTVDRSPHKQGKKLPGSHIPILPPDALVKERPDYAVILPWNIAEEVVGQQRGYVAGGGRFIIPVPRPRVL